MARTVSDLEILLEVMAGPDIGDPSFAPVPIRRFTEAEAQRLRVACFEEDERIPVTPETRKAVSTAAEALQQQGFEVEPFRPEGLEEARRLWWELFGLAGAVVLGPIFAGREAELSPILREFVSIVAAERPLTLERFMNALLERDALRARFLQQMEKFPLLLCPVCAIPAFRHGQRSWTVNGHSVGYMEAMSYAQWFNLLGNPAAVVPVGQSVEGLPIAVQIVGRPWEEEAVLAIARKIEEACGRSRRPL